MSWHHSIDFDSVGPQPLDDEDNHFYKYYYLPGDDQFHIWKSNYYGDPHHDDILADHGRYDEPVIRGWGEMGPNGHVQLSTPIDEHTWTAEPEEVEQWKQAAAYAHQQATNHIRGEGHKVGDMMVNDTGAYSA